MALLFLGRLRLCPSQVGQWRVMGRQLVSKRNCCCGGSLLSYRIGTLLTSQGLAVCGRPVVGAMCA